MKFVKHIHVLNLLSTIPPYQGHGWENKNMTPEQATDCWDHLFEYIHSRWARPASADLVKETGWSWYTKDTKGWTAEQVNEMLDCRAMLDMNSADLEEKLESLPPYFREEIFPVAVGRYLLRDLRIPMNHRKTKTFTEFHHRYGAMILAS
jgi:hypothetical protein